MKFKNSVFVCLSLALAARLTAQINIPTKDIFLDIPASAPAMTVYLGSDHRNILLTPFYISGAGLTGNEAAAANVALWFCMDPMQNIYYNASSQTTPTSTIKYNPSLTDYNSYDNWQAPSTGTGGLNDDERRALANLFSKWTPTHLQTSAEQYLAEVFQLAVWEIVNENFTSFKPGGKNAADSGGTNSFNLTTGDFHVTTTASNQYIINAAQSLLDSINITQTVNTTGNLRYLTDGEFGAVPMQDLLGWCPPIPEPSTYGAAAVGLMGLAIFAKRRAQKSKLSTVAPESPGVRADRPE